MKLKKLNKKQLSILSLLVLFISALYQIFSGDFSEGKKVLGEVTEDGLEIVVVEKIVDGDTIQLFDGRKVRYIGIDTPETKDPRVGVECFGKEASKANEDIVAGQTVSLEKDTSETDRYGRLLRYVWLGDVLVNKKLVEEGYAFARSYPPDVKKQEELRLAEENARNSRRGLWSSCQLNDTSKINQDIQKWDQQFEKDLIDSLTEIFSFN
ncbi:MAG: thermonuclease family protein [Patescibacteria group bacterium]